MHAFTVGVCLPAALAEAGDGPHMDSAVSRMATHFPMFAKLHAWAKATLPAFASDDERRAFVAAMCTKGGVAEAIVTGLRAGQGMCESLQAGLGRCRELEQDVR